MADDQEARVGQSRPQLQNIQRRNVSGGFQMTMFFLVRDSGQTRDEGGLDRLSGCQCMSSARLHRRRKVPWTVNRSVVGSGQWAADLRMQLDL